jgi:hypothetical protein
MSTPRVSMFIFALLPNASSQSAGREGEPSIPLDGGKSAAGWAWTRPAA